MNHSQKQLRERILALPSALRAKLFIEDDTDSIGCALYADAKGDIFVMPDEQYYKRTHGVVRLMPQIVVPFCYAYNLGEFESVEDYETAVLTSVVDENIEAIERKYTANLATVRAPGDLNPNPMFGF
jgi:hypothetical protein